MSNIFCVWSVGETPRVGAPGTPLWIIRYWLLSEMLIRMEQSRTCGSGRTVTWWSCARCGFLRENAQQCPQSATAVHSNPLSDWTAKLNFHSGLARKQAKKIVFINSLIHLMASFLDSLVFLHAATTAEKGKDHICYEAAPGSLHI